MLFTSSMVLSEMKTDKITYYITHQIFFGFLPGIILAYFFSKISLDFLKKITPFFFLLVFVLLTLVLVPALGFESGGAVRWLQVGPIILQPSEFAKLAVILYLAALFEKKTKEKIMKSFKEAVLPFLFVLAPFAFLLLLQPDMGTLGIISLISLSMFFGARGSIPYTVLFICAGIFLVVIASILFPYVSDRLQTFLNPEDDTSGISYQINQSLIAIGSGGIFGVGFGNGIQKYSYLPEPMGDTIFAVWGEETGFLGSILIVWLYLIICVRGFIIAKKAASEFNRFVAIGITSWIGFQAFLHIMAVCGLIPFSGMPLPFISYGGTALICVLAGAGILINISKKSIRFPA